MPAVATLTNNTSVNAFTCPPGAYGFILWNTSAAALRWRPLSAAAASGANEGIPLPAGSSTDPKIVTHYFVAKLSAEVSVQIFQNSGGDITSGVGYEILKR